MAKHRVGMAWRSWSGGRSGDSDEGSDESPEDLERRLLPLAARAAAEARSLQARADEWSEELRRGADDLRRQQEEAAEAAEPRLRELRELCAELAELRSDAAGASGAGGTAAEPKARLCYNMLNYKMLYYDIVGYIIIIHGNIM